MTLTVSVPDAEGQLPFLCYGNIYIPINFYIIGLAIISQTGIPIGKKKERIICTQVVCMLFFF